MCDTDDDTLDRSVLGRDVLSDVARCWRSKWWASQITRPSGSVSLSKRTCCKESGEDKTEGENAGSGSARALVGEARGERSMVWSAEIHVLQSWAKRSSSHRKPEELMLEAREAADDDVDFDVVEGDEDAGLGVTDRRRTPILVANSQLRSAEITSLSLRRESAGGHLDGEGRDDEEMEDGA